MRTDAKATEALRALAKAIEKTFTEGRWHELGLLTNTHDLVTEHARLLRSLSWGDPDYSACIFEVLPAVLGAGRGASIRGQAYECFPRLREVEDFVGLERWLEDHDLELHRALYAGEDVAALDDLLDAARSFGIEDIETHATRIRGGLREDPAQAIGSAKELLETTLKEVLGLHGSGPETKVELPALVKKANLKLGIDPTQVDGSEPGAGERRRLVGALNTIVQAGAELRNLGFGTGHGVSRGPTLDVATARMVVSAAVTVATFYVEAYAALRPARVTERRLADDDIPF
jgi:hypothetical protein